jgi:glutamate-1-semialdehyde 2,1-aminomutase
MREAVARSPLGLTFHRIGSMFCLFFAAGPVRNLADARRSDTGLFARFFRGCLDRGVYFAPSQFEAGFLSLAHSAEDLNGATEIAGEVLRGLAKDA